MQPGKLIQDQDGRRIVGSALQQVGIHAKALALHACMQFIERTGRPNSKTLGAYLDLCMAVALGHDLGLTSQKCKAASVYMAGHAVQLLCMGPVMGGLSMTA